jgi:hypothetical protein
MRDMACSWKELAMCLRLLMLCPLINGTLFVPRTVPFGDPLADTIVDPGLFTDAAGDMKLLLLLAVLAFIGLTLTDCTSFRNMFGV